MIVSEMYRRELNIGKFKAWSQSLGHEGAMTTLTSYGTLSLEEQGRLIADSSNEPQDHPLTRADLEEVIRKLSHKPSNV